MSTSSHRHSAPPDELGGDVSSWRCGRVGIVGAGAMGTSLAAIIGQAVPTVVVCRDHRRAAQLFEHGAVTTGLIPASSKPIIVSSINDLSRIGGVSVLFVATKTTAIDAVARELKPHLYDASDQPGGLYVVSYQNGIEPGKRLLDLLEYPRVLRMVLTFGCVMDRDTGIVETTLNAPPHAIGSIDPAYRVVCARIADVLTQSGFETAVVEDIEPRVWSKAILNASMNPVAALVNSTVADVQRSPAKIIVKRLLREAHAVAQAEGLDLGDDYLERAEAMMAQAGPHTPSMVEDIRSGRESEVGQLNQQIIHHGANLGVPTPTHEVIDALIETFDWQVYRRKQAAASAKRNAPAG